MKRVFASLAVRNFRNYAVGMLLSNVGMWMSRTAQSWLVLMVLTAHDAGALGIITGLQFLPVLVLSQWGGSLADRFPKRKILLVTQSIMGVNALTLGALVMSGHATLPLVYTAALIEGSASAVDTPARQSFVSEMVPRRQLSNAISLNSAMFNAARLIGPGVAGVLIAVVGTGPVFVINGISFSALLLALVTLNRSALTPAPRSSGKGRILEGLRYVSNRPDIMLVMAIAFMMGTFGMNFQMTNVLMATEIFHKGAAQYGVLGSIMAIGSLVAALMSARRDRPRLRHLLVALAAFVVMTAVSAASTTFWFFALTLVPIGLSAITVLVTANSLVQSRVEASVRGRVMALYFMLFTGGTPIGAPVIGWVGEQFGARWTLWIGSGFVGLTLVVAMVYLWHHEQVSLKLRRDHRVPRLEVVHGRVTEPVPEKVA